MLKNWDIVEDHVPVGGLTSIYSAPECSQKIQVFRLSGNVYNHSKYGEGKEITTSIIAAFEPETRTVTTQSGSYYTLDGEPSPGFVAFLMKEHGFGPSPLIADIFRWQCPNINFK